VKYNSTGIQVNAYLQTSQSHIFVVEDCNGYAQYSHAAMHQGMIAIANCLLPHPFKQDFRKFVVPWTIFTEPQISHVDSSQAEL
jgi:pyruvate/2-oxoglutarate dehydrogenase complex dihydrolipoamide dehydrogenase (E3) component